MHPSCMRVCNSTIEIQRKTLYIKTFTVANPTKNCVKEIKIARKLVKKSKFDYQTPILISLKHYFYHVIVLELCF